MCIIINKTKCDVDILMVISKDFLNEGISEYRRKLNEEPDTLMRQYYSGIIKGLEIAYAELTKPPKSKNEIESEKKDQIFNPNKIFRVIVDYYVDKQGKSRDEAEQIAIKTIKDQQQKRMNQFLTNQKLETVCHKCDLVQPSINIQCHNCGIVMGDLS